MMYHLRVLWDHELWDQPIVIYSEIDDDGWEVRKVEIYRDGRSAFADSVKSTGNTMLSEKKIPYWGSFSDTSTLSREEITAEMFEQAWRNAVRKLEPET